MKNKQRSTLSILCPPGTIQERRDINLLEPGNMLFQTRAKIGRSFQLRRVKTKPSLPVAQMLQSLDTGYMCMAVIKMQSNLAPSFRYIP